MSWKYLYIAAGLLCALLCLAAMRTKYPDVKVNKEDQISLKKSLKMTEVTGINYKKLILEGIEVVNILLIFKLKPDFDTQWCQRPAETCIIIINLFGPHIHETR